MDLVIEVKDAAGSSIEGAEVTILLQGGERRSGTTDGRGQSGLGPVPGADFQLKVSHALYVEEEVGVIPPKGAGQFLWDNPVWIFTPPASIVVKLSRIRAVPLAPMSDEEMKRRSSYNPQAAFIWVDPAGNPTQRYLGLYNNENTFVPIAHPLLPENPGEGWGRFNHGEPVKIDPSRAGNFFWLEWGAGSNNPKLLVAVWVPRWRMTPSKLDYTIFFTPSTYKPDYPDLKDYSYMAWKAEDRLVQPYIGLGQRYLFHEKWLAYQLLAAKRQSILVVPIHPKGQWGPFTHAAGLSRLLAEITHFLHRTGYTSGGHSLTEEDHAPRPNYRFGRMAIQQPMPVIQRIVLSGFSAGVGPIVGMLPTSIGQRMNDRNYSVNGIDSHVLFGADVAPFLQAWKEVWDHDAPAYIRVNLDKYLPTWMRADGKRMARCYQTDYTGSQGWIEKTPMLEFVAGALKKPVNGLVAAERHSDSRCSLVYFGQGYLKHAASAAAMNPVFWTANDDHHAVPMVTFMHAALLSGLSRM